jgi:hypothetical protein
MVEPRGVEPLILTANETAGTIFLNAYRFTWHVALAMTSPQLVIPWSYGAVSNPAAAEVGESSIDFIFAAFKHILSFSTNLPRIITHPQELHAIIPHGAVTKSPCGNCGLAHAALVAFICKASSDCGRSTGLQIPLVGKCVGILVCCLRCECSLDASSGINYGITRHISIVSVCVAGINSTYK